MKNKEKYKDEIFEIACLGESVTVSKNGNIAGCNCILCDDCMFAYSGHDKCRKGFLHWCDSEYLDWYTIKKDTEILVSNDGKTFFNRHFAKYENNEVYAYDSGRTSWSSHGEYTPWKYARLRDGVN